MSTRILTGITTTGTPHLGNYAGAIRPAVRMSQQADTDAYFFLADYHALIKCDEPERVARSRQEIAAAWISAGLDIDKVTFYRQSDIPEVLEIAWMLSCVTAKGLMNRAHAYKAAVDQNLERGAEPDDGVSMGLFSYPVLMAADILIFNAHQVPVGHDQIQHIEMARDIAARFNQLYAKQQPFFVLPEAIVQDDVALLPGLDGRKMSKSYNNTIPLFEGGAKATRDAIMRIVTDSRQPGEPKEAEGSQVYALYRAFATAEQAAEFKASLEEGLGWGEAKEQLAQQIELELAPMRERYAHLMANPQEIDEILQVGADRARKQSHQLLQRLREVVGLAPVQRVIGAASTTLSTKKVGTGRPPRFVSFKENEGFRFRLLDGQGTQLLLSGLFDSPQQAGQLIAHLQENGLADGQKQLDGEQTELVFEGYPPIRFETAHEAAIETALQALRDLAAT